MKITKTIITILLILATLLLLISYFLPYVEVSTKNGLFKEINDDAYPMYSLTKFDFNIFFILIPILSIVFMLFKSKPFKLLSIGLLITTFFSNLFYMLSMNGFLKHGTYKYSSGMILFLMSTIIIGMCAIAIIITKVIEQTTISKVEVVNSETLPRSLKNLNELREKNFITAEEYEEKRANLVKLLKI